MSLSYFTYFVSFFFLVGVIQIFTGLFDYYVIQLNIPSKLIILKQVIIMELIVQIIEGIFYVWLVLNIASVLI